MYYEIWYETNGGDNRCHGTTNSKGLSFPLPIHEDQLEELWWRYAHRKGARVRQIDLEARSRDYARTRAFNRQINRRKRRR